MLLVKQIPKKKKRNQNHGFHFWWNLQSTCLNSIGDTRKLSYRILPVLHHMGQYEYQINGGWIYNELQNALDVRKWEETRGQCHLYMELT